MSDKSDKPPASTDGDEPNSQEKKQLMEEAQEDAARERESEGGYQ